MTSSQDPSSAERETADAVDWSAETLTDLVDRLEREAFQRSLAQRGLEGPDGR